MASQSRIAELAAVIAREAAKIDEVAAQTGHSSPSFAPDGSAQLLSLPEVARSRAAVLQATDELHSLMLGPVGLLTPSHNALVATQATARHNLAKHVPLAGGTASFSEIAAASQLPVHFVTRVIRQAAAHHVFREPRKGHVEHTAASKLLAEDPLMSSWVQMVTDEMWPAATKVVDAVTTWPGPEEPVHTGYNLAHDTQCTIFDELSKYPERQKRYANAMTWFNGGPGLETKHVLDNYPWDSFGPITVVDLGGGHGAVSIALAQRFPLIKCIVQDQPGVIAEGRAKAPPELTERVEFMEHDFFQDQPQIHAQVFLARWILHDWPDSYCVRILRALRPALSSGVRILLLEYVLPEPGALSFYQEKLVRNMDIAMLGIHNGKERDRAEWEELLRQADSRFSLLQVIQPAASRLAIIELGWQAA